MLSTMSLQELSGSSIHLKLSIREGHGFGFLKNPVVVVAGTNGIFLETDVVPPSPDPLFHIDLVWETDKKNLRRFRASNTPIKLECFTISLSNQRDCIGSILLNIKSAQVIPRGSQNNVNERWHKLIGVPAEAKALQPELLLSLTIQEPNSLSQPLSGSSWEGKELQEQALSAQHGAAIDRRNMSKLSSPAVNLSVLPSAEFKQGYVQLGPETSCVDTFLLTLTVKNALEIELLLCGHETVANFNGSLTPFQISFSLMGHEMRTKPFEGKSLGQVHLEVTLPLRTSLSVLHLYLQENPCAAVCLLYCGQEIAAAELHIRSLVPTNDVQSFSREFCGETSFTQKCILVSSRSGIIPVQDGHQPSIEVTTKLQLASSTVALTKVPPVLNQPKLISDCTSFQTCVTSKEDVSTRSESRQSQDTFVVTSQSGPVWVPVAPALIQAQQSISNTLSNLKNGKEPNTRCMEIKITLKRVEFHHLPRTPWVRFLFECPNSSSVSSKCTDLHVAHNQSSVLVEGMSATISSQSLDSIQVHIFEIGADLTTSQQFATAKIDSNTLLLKEKEDSVVSSDLKEPKSERSLGILHTTVSVQRHPQELLEKLGSERIMTNCQSLCNVASALTQSLLNGSSSGFQEATIKSLPIAVQENLPPLDFSTQPVKCSDNIDRVLPLNKTFSSLPVTSPAPQVSTSSHTHQEITCPAPLDGSTAYKIVEELEDWKEKQQEIFLEELKQKEIEHISRITDEWTKQTKLHNIELDNKMSECKTLATTLTNAKQDLKDRLKTCATREQELRKAKEELDLQYNLKFQELTLAAKQLDEGVKIKATSFEKKCSNLEQRLKELESENESLRRQLSQRVSAHSHQGNVQTCGMSHSQVSQLMAQVDQLGGKLCASLESKAYFKEQWGRAVREMNQAKLQCAKRSENSKSLENLLSKEETELQKDERTLEKLREELALFRFH